MGLQDSINELCGNGEFYPGYIELRADDTYKKICDHIAQEIVKKKKIIQGKVDMTHISFGVEFFSIKGKELNGGKIKILTYHPGPYLKQFMDRLFKLAEADNIKIHPVVVGDLVHTLNQRAIPDGNEITEYGDIYSEYEFINKHAKYAYGIFRVRNPDLLNVFIRIKYEYYKPE